MRMVHYYLALAILLVPALLLTLASGAFFDGSQRHLVLGLFTAIGCVAQNTLLILFMIVTGRVLKAAMAARELPAHFLAELNEFFARRRAYPLALLAAGLAVATAVLGYGRFIGVPTPVHMLLGLATVLLNLAALSSGVRTLRANQDLLDRATHHLDALDRVHPPPPEEGDPIPWRVAPQTRWIVFAACAWLPYLYWGALVWRGEFGHVPALLLWGSALASSLGLLRAWRVRSAGREGSPPGGIQSPFGSPRAASSARSRSETSRYSGQMTSIRRR